MLLDVLTKCFQILEEVFSCDMEGDTATQTSVVDRFFLMVVFFLCPFVYYRKVCEWMHPKKGNISVHFSPTCLKHIYSV